MTPNLGVELDANAQLATITRNKAVAVLRAYALANPPSRFGVYQVERDSDGPGYDGQLIGWGLACADYIDVHSIEPGLRGRFSTIDAMTFLFGTTFEIVWIDPQPPALDNADHE